MTAHDAGSELDFTDSHRWSADGWCFTHSTEAGPVYCRRPVVWESCSGCGKDYAYPHLCREHQLCGLCHPDLPKTSAMSELLGVSERWLKADPGVIGPDDARWVLGYYDLDGGEKPGGFRTHLINAMTQADPRNLHLLAYGFPGLVAAFQAQRDVAGLRAIADRAAPAYECPHCGAVSHHPTDRAQRYCGACHRFAEDSLQARVNIREKP